MRFETPGGINLEDIFGQNQRSPRKDIRYEITINGDQAASGVEKYLVRRG